MNSAMTTFVTINAAETTLIESLSKSYRCSSFYFPCLLQGSNLTFTRLCRSSLLPFSHHCLSSPSISIRCLLCSIFWSPFLTVLFQIQFVDLDLDIVFQTQIYLSSPVKACILMDVYNAVLLRCYLCQGFCLFCFDFFVLFIVAFVSRM